MATEDIVRLKDFTPVVTCPKCGRRYFTRSARIEGEGFDDPLYLVKEACIMCGWKRRVHNVRISY